MAHPFRKLLWWALTLVGALLCLFGLWAIGAYVWGVLAILDEPDKSWIFWGLAILFIGIIAAALGAVLLVFGWKALRKTT